MSQICVNQTVENMLCSYALAFTLRLTCHFLDYVALFVAELNGIRIWHI